MNEMPPILDAAALAALRKTRPWLYLIGIFSSVISVLALLALIGGLIGLHASPAQSHLLTLGAGFTLLVSLPSAVAQLGYAFALSRIGEAAHDALEEALELACLRQRNLWFVNAITVALLVAWTVFGIIAPALVLSL